MELLNWVNAYLGMTYSKVEDLSSRAAYWKFTDMIFAGTVNLSKMDVSAKRGRESVQKPEVLREVFEQVCDDREVLLERLAEGSYRDNLELLQWLKDLFDAQYPGPVAVLLEPVYAMPYNYPTSELYTATTPPCTTVATPRTTMKRITRPVPDAFFKHSPGAHDTRRWR